MRPFHPVKDHGPFVSIVLIVVWIERRVTDVHPVHGEFGLDLFGDQGSGRGFGMVLGEIWGRDWGVLKVEHGFLDRQI